MRLPALLTADLHFVAEPSAEYRWELWTHLRQFAKEERVKTICILGDLVDRKDNHPAVLVNRLADEIKRTRDETSAELVLLAGNHDWLKEGEEFFRFLRHMDGVHYVSDLWEHPDTKGPLAVFLPYRKDPARAYAKLQTEHYDYVFMHQTLKGSRSSNGEVLDGEDIGFKLEARKTYSGDIHVPQIVRGPWGEVEYVGSPYHVHFGDNFKPRVVLLESGGRAVDLHVPGMPKRIAFSAQSMEHLKSFYWERGDQAKIRLMLHQEDVHRWATFKRDALDWLNSRSVSVEGIELVTVGGDNKRVTHNRAYRLSGMPPADAVLKYVQDEELGGDAYEVGMALL